MKQVVAAIWLVSVSLRAGAALASPQHETPRASSGEILLEGVIVSRDPSSSIALLRRSGASRARAIRVGESFHGMKLVSVTETGAFLEGEGGRVALELGRLAAAAWSAPHESAPPSPPTRAEEDLARPGPGLAIGGWIRRELARSVAEERLAKELPVILAETALAPWFEEGQVKGLRITRLPERTVLAETGLRLGDVLLSINEIPLNSLTALAGLYPRLQSESEIRVVLEREGRLLKLAYELQ